MRFNKWLIAAFFLAVMVLAEGAVLAQSKLDISGRTYTKWLWGNARREGSSYNYSDIPNDGAGDNGQFTEIEIFFNAQVSKYVEIQSRIHSRFNQNYWTNFGGFGGRTNEETPCIAGDCGEYSPLSNQYIKLRGMTVFLRPGYGWLDEVLIGNHDMGGWDPWVVGQIRYIDRDNPAGVIARGSFFNKAITWRGQRLSLPRLWAGPGFNTGDYHSADGAYTALVNWSPTEKIDITALWNWINDIEVDPTDLQPDDGIDTRVRYRNMNYGVRLNFRPTDNIELRGNYYYSKSNTESSFGASYASFSPVLYGDDITDSSWKVAADFNNIAGTGLSVKGEYFDVGADYVALLASRREADILLTEGWDAAFALPGPDNLRYSVYRDPQYLQGEALAQNIGWGGWNGTTQQVVSLGVDNNITDFDEPLAQDVHGWKGFTIVPLWQKGDFTLQGEFTWIDYNTNWDTEWGGNPGRYPTFEWFTGVSTFRPVYQPYQDRDTKIYVLNAKYLIPIGKGLEINGKVKKIEDTDKRLNNPDLVPDIIPQDVTEDENYDTTNSPYSWAPFDDVTDDDRDLDYITYQVGLGYQFREEFWAGLRYELYDVTLLDGTTAIRGAFPGNWYGYGDQADPNGDYNKNKFSVLARYTLGGAEIGFEYQYNFGDFTPNFGTDFAPFIIDGKPYFKSIGYRNAQPMFKRDFDQQRLKAYLKVSF